MNWGYLITGCAVVIALLGLVYQLAVRRSDATIKALEAHNKWLKEQVEQAEKNAPDVLAERLSKRVVFQKEELEQLAKDYEVNRSLILQKEDELARAEELIGELEYFKEQFGCPYCGAELTSLGGDEEEFRAYSCGYSSGYYQHSCPKDPDFPILEDYELETKQDAGGTWFCYPKAKSGKAYKLELDYQSGRTEEEARQKVVKRYEYHARNVPERIRSNIL